LISPLIQRQYSKAAKPPSTWEVFSGKLFRSPELLAKYNLRVAKPEVEVREPFGVLEEEQNAYVDEYYTAVNQILDHLNIPEEQRAQFVKDHDFSQGFMTLEWTIPSPPPDHTFDETPIMKELAEQAEGQTASSH